MRWALAFWLILGTSGCCQPWDLSPPLPDAACPPTTLDAGLTCALPSYLPPSEVTTWEEFLATASALVCIGAIHDRVGGVFVESWCHPGFADLYLRRSGARLSGFPEVEARACLELLEQSPLGGLFECFAVLNCGAEECCPQRADEGRACGGNEDCAPWLVCDAHLCRARRACPEDPCPYSEDRCEDGRCVRTPFAACSGPGCGIGGAPCVTGCLSGSCACGQCTGLRPIGCTCVTDADCPVDVSVCSRGLCTARPMLGERCEGEVPCFGAFCVDGVCSAIPEGELGCVGDAECAPGLTCAPVPCSFGFCTDTACITPTREGDPCALGSICVGGLFCRAGTCRIAAAIGEFCLGSVDCGDLAFCTEGRCTPRPVEGEACADPSVPCIAGLECRDGECSAHGGPGAPCGAGTSSGSGCSAANYCRASRCAPRVALGETCAHDNECPADAFCETETCQPRIPVGVACTADECVVGARCVEGLCYGRTCR